MRAGWRVAKWFGLGSLGFTLLVMLAVAAGLGWLAETYSKAHPWDVTRYWGQVESYLAKSGLRLTVGKVEVFYDDAPVIRVSDVGILGPDGRLSVFVEHMAIKLANRRLFLLNASPKVVEADGVTLRLVRQGDGVQVAGFEVAGGTPEQAKSGGLVEWLNGMTMDMMWGRLKEVKVDNMNLLLRDDVQQAEWVLEGGTLHFSRYEDSGERATLTAQIRRLYGGKELGVMPVLVTFEHAPKGVEAYVSARLDGADVGLVADYLPPQLQDLLKAKGGVEIGTSVLKGNRLGQPWVTLRLNNVVVNAPKAYAKPMLLPKVLLTASYVPSPTDVLEIKNLLIQNARGEPWRMYGRVTSLTTDPLMDIRAESAVGDVQGVFDFFPDQEHGFAKALHWLRPNLKNVQYSNLRARYAGRPSAFPRCGDACGVIEVDADYAAGGQIMPLPGIEPVVSGGGMMRWRGQTLDVWSAEGTMGASQKVRNVRVRISEMLSHLPTIVEVSASVSGELKELMGEIAKLDDNDRVPTDVGGSHVTDLSVVVPMPIDVTPTFAASTVEVSGTVRNLVLRGVKELDGDVLAAERAEVKLFADKTLRIVAVGRLAGNPLGLVWQQSLMPGMPDAMQAKINGIFGGEWLQKKAGKVDGVALSGNVAVRGDVVQMPKGGWEFMLRADAAKAKVAVKDVNYAKKAGEALVMQVQGSYGADDKLTLNKLLVDGKDAKVMGTVVFDKARGDETVVRLEPFRLGATDAVVDYAGGKAVVTGKRLDLRGLDLFGGDDGEDVVKNVNVQLDVQEILTAQGRMTGVKGDLSARGGVWDVQSFTALVDGTARVNIRLVPLAGQKGRRKLTLNIDDLGRTLKTMGLYDSLKGGRMWGEITYDTPKVGGGLLKIEKFEVQNPPTMMKILGLLSLQQLVAGSDGTLFDKAVLPVRVDGDMVYLDNASMEGPSMSLRLDGGYDRKRKELNFDGKLAPALPFNRLVGKVPLLGTLLTGSQDGVVVADFKLKGPSNDPKVEVRPLSILTPGLLKDIFRGVTGAGNAPKPKVQDGRTR